MFKLSSWSKRALAVGLMVFAVLLVGAYPKIGEAKPEAVAPALGKAKSFAVLAGSTVTNTGASSVSGNLGVWPGTAITGFPPGVIFPPGTKHSADAVAQQAQSAVTTAYNNLAGQPCNFDLTGQDLGGKTLTPGVYCFPNTTAQLTGALTLDAQGDSNSVFIFQIGSALTTASNSSVLVINSGADCNIFWQVGSSATLGTTTSFKGNILALASITLNTSANIDSGRALARNGAVTMDTNTVSISGCSLAPTNTPPPATQTAIAATQTVVASTATAVAATQTAVALTPPPPETQTAIAATQTSIAATETVVGATQTAIAITVAPSLTAQAATLTATAQFPTPTRTASRTRTPTRTRTPRQPTPTQTATRTATKNPGGGNESTPTPFILSTVVATATSTLPTFLPVTGSPDAPDMTFVWIALGVAGIIVVSVPLWMRRRR